MRCGGEGWSKEMVGELVFHQDFLSVFKATRRLPGAVANGISFPFDKIPVSSASRLVVLIASTSYSSSPSMRSGGGFMKLGPWVSVSR